MRAIRNLTFACALASPALAEPVTLVALGDSLTAGVEVSTLAEADHLLGDRAEGLGLGERGADATMFDQAAGEVGKQRAPVGGGALELGGVASMSHRVRSLS